MGRPARGRQRTPSPRAPTRSYGVIAAQAIPPDGAKVRSKDALIAAQAHRHGGTLMTANTDYFARFSRLIAVVEPVLR